jgi:hypothetical protein
MTDVVHAAGRETTVRSPTEAAAVSARVWTSRSTDTTGPDTSRRSCRSPIRLTSMPSVRSASDKRSATVMSSPCAYRTCTTSMVTAARSSALSAWP